MSERKHPDAIDPEIAKAWLDETAAFLAGDEGQGLSEDARAFAIRYLSSVTAGKPIALKRGRRSRESAAAHIFLEVLASGEADSWATGYKIVAKQMGMKGIHAERKIERWCKSYFAARNPYPAKDIKQGLFPPKPKALRDWFSQAFEPESKASDENT
jgi:hypothetical protein